MPRPVFPPALQRLLAPLALAASRGLGILAQVILQIVVGNLGGATGLGLLQLFASWTSVIGEIVGGGYPTRALRDSAVQSAAGDYAGIRRSLMAAGRHVMGLAAAAMLLTALLFAAGVVTLASVGTATIVTVIFSAPAFAASRICAEALKGLDRPLAAVTLENLSLPLTLLMLCGVLALSGGNLSATTLLAGAAVGTFVTLGALAFALWRTLPGRKDVDQRASSALAGREQLHFWANGLLNIAFLQLPFLLLPLFAAVEDIGRFAVAHKLVNIITTLLILLAAVFGPRFARAAAKGDAGALRELLARTQLISTLIFFPGASALLIGAGPLAQLFSLPTSSLDLLLAILCAGQLVNAATGLPGVLLTLSGAARQEMRLQAASLALTGLALVLLGSPWGVLGIAAAMSAGIAVKNIASYLAARKYLSELGAGAS